jgi:hypothetical protein
MITGARKVEKSEGTDIKIRRWGKWGQPQNERWRFTERGRESGLSFRV